MTPPPRMPPPFTADWLADVIARLHEGKPVRRGLPDGGRLHIDRPLPFLLVHRLARPQDEPDEGTDRLVMSVASYLVAPGEGHWDEDVRRLIEALALVMRKRYGNYLLIEIWGDEHVPVSENGESPPPAFELKPHPVEDLAPVTRTLAKGLVRVSISGRRGEVSIETSGGVGRPGRRPLFGKKALDEHGMCAIGVAVRPVYRDEEGNVYPLLLRKLKRRMGRALERTVYQFALSNTDLDPSHYYALGRRAMVKGVWQADDRLAAIDGSFDLLLLATPVNGEQVWEGFAESGFRELPRLRYRPLPFDPRDMKRELWRVDVDRLEDPTLIRMFHDKQRELDHRLTMLADIGTSDFLYGSLQVHGPVERGLLEHARMLLGEVEPEGPGGGRKLGAKALATLAREEIDRYREQDESFQAEVEIHDDLYSGLLVSRRALLIGDHVKVHRARARALVHHEVGVHLVTYNNGAVQPFHMLATGLPGYEALQEGLAVFAEYLAGGLYPSRLRVLAARVVAAASVASGASFAETWAELRDGYGFGMHGAFTVALRAHRAGGMTKDAMYLRGLVNLLAYLGEGGDYENLLLGKYATSHVPMVMELLQRGVLEPARFTPTVLRAPGARMRMDRARGGLAPYDLLEASG